MKLNALFSPNLGTFSNPITVFCLAWYKIAKKVESFTLDVGKIAFTIKTEALMDELMSSSFSDEDVDFNPYSATTILLFCCYGLRSLLGLGIVYTNLKTEKLITSLMVASASHGSGAACLLLSLLIPPNQVINKLHKSNLIFFTIAELP